jgi:uncharacterized protein (DUF2236 family)
MPPLANSLIDRTKRTIVGEVRAVFNDRARGEKPVVRRPDGIFGQGSVIWRVHGDVTTMMVGGIAALLLQMLHPSVLAGVWDHSDFRHDMLGRLRRTARFIALTTYGSRDEADAAVERVRLVHERVRGSLPSGQAYGANDPHLLAWVHVTEATSFLDAWIRYGEPAMSAADQDRYFAEFARVAEMLGADPIPRTRREAHALMSASYSEHGLPGADRAGRRRSAAILGAQDAPSPEHRPGETAGAGGHLRRRQHDPMGFPLAARDRPAMRMLSGPANAQKGFPCSRSSPSQGWKRPTAPASGRSRGSTSKSRAERSSPCSARMAPARRR